MENNNNNNEENPNRKKDMPFSSPPRRKIYLNDADGNIENRSVQESSPSSSTSRENSSFPLSPVSVFMPTVPAPVPPPHENPDACAIPNSPPPIQRSTNSGPSDKALSFDPLAHDSTSS